MFSSYKRGLYFTLCL